jgi:hypothetical protein
MYQCGADRFHVKLRYLQNTAQDFRAESDSVIFIRREMSVSYFIYKPKLEIIKLESIGVY